MPDERICATCQHWTQDAEYIEGDCARLHAATTAVGAARAVLSLATEARPARVMVPPDFGCRYWEAK